jgi:hypothetical protein
VHAAGFSSETRLVDVVAGEHERVVITLSVPAAPTPPPQTVPSALSAPVRKVPEGVPPPSVALTAAGVICFGFGTYFGIRAFDEKHAMSAYCNGATCTSSGIDQYNEARTSADLSTAAFGLGLASVATAATWWIFDKRSRTLAIAPLLSGSTTGVIVRGVLR